MEYEGTQDQVDAYLKRVAAPHYVYVLKRPCGTPFYVGKGSNRRIFEHELEAKRHHPAGEVNPFKCNVIRKILRSGDTVNYCIESIFGTGDEQLAFDRESALIGKHGRLHEGGPLTNLAGGKSSCSPRAPLSAERHAATLSGEPTDNPQRAILNRFLQSIGPLGSVPAKPVRQISRLLPTTPHTQTRTPSKRCAYALIASAIAHGQRIAPGVEIPRRFSYDGVDAVIENGVSRDLVKANMAELVFADAAINERYRLNSPQCALLQSLVGKPHLEQRGLI